MLMPIDEFCKKMFKDDPTITPAEMLHNLHAGGYDREISVCKVKEFFSDLTCDSMCSIIVNEYFSPLIDKAELKRLLLLCRYQGNEADKAIDKHYPKPLGYVMMLDDSGSMYSASAMIKIDAKAFLDCTRTGDQFGINRFDDRASWIYPEGDAPKPMTVTEAGDEKQDAKKEIDKLSTTGIRTNIGAAISLGNNMSEQMETQLKAFVLISDGEANCGDAPEKVLKEEPPVYIAGLGPYMRKDYFTQMLAKNAKSRFYNSPNAYDMMKVFNDILADSTNALLGLNSLDSCQGTDYSIKEFTISGQGNLSRVSVVWSDGRYHYTSGYPDKNSMNIVLINPDGKQLDTKPVIVEDGYCIFELRNVRPGKWHVLSQYALENPVWCTVGVIEEDTPVKVEITGEQFININGQMEYGIHVSNADLLRNLSVKAVYSEPAADVRKLMETMRKDHDIPENAMTDADHMLFSRKYAYGTVMQKDTGSFTGNMGNASNTGIYNARFAITGVYKDGTPFSCYKMHSVMAG